MFFIVPFVLAASMNTALPRATPLIVSAQGSDMVRLGKDGDPYGPSPYGRNPHGPNPHGPDPHDETYDEDLPANNPDKYFPQGDREESG